MENEDLGNVPEGLKIEIVDYVATVLKHIEDDAIYVIKLDLCEACENSVCATCVRDDMVKLILHMVAFKGKREDYMLGLLHPAGVEWIRNKYVFMIDLFLRGLSKEYDVEYDVVERLFYDTLQNDKYIKYIDSLIK